MTRRGAVGIWGLALLALGLGACGSSARRAEPPPLPVEPPASQVGYCERLQPLLTQAVTSARIGTQMACLDIPGVTELGRFGSSGAAEEGALADCFDEPGEYQKLLEATESEFDLSIDQGFSADVARAGAVSLTTLVPWLPSMSLDVSRTRRVTARVSLKHARFVTLLGVASRLQGQKR
ncbi:MAG TPA: hypothetical protein VEQ58_07655, partial [Polyangiaceae bacterium]|nr:hypothetical protein [Polyangiaceae bacterium]